MLRLIRYILIYLTAPLLLHFNANAQTAWVEVDYAEKIETIRLAKAGDADALYKLGLSHFNAASSTQGQIIAERFFYYASKKGHDQAKQYLTALQNINGISPTIKPTHKEPVKSGDIKPESKIQTNKSIDEQTVAAVIVGAPKDEPAKSKVELNKSTDEHIIVRSDDRSIEPAAITSALKEDIPPVETSYAKVAANFNQNKVIKPDNQSSNLYHPKRELDQQPLYKTIWMNIVKLLLFMTVLLVFAGLITYLMSYIKIRKMLPEGFNSKVYLTLNPDVKAAGIKAETHYFLHGKREGRQYR